MQKRKHSSFVSNLFVVLVIFCTQSFIFDTFAYILHASAIRWCISSFHCVLLALVYRSVVILVSFRYLWLYWVPCSTHKAFICDKNDTTSTICSMFNCFSLRLLARVFAIPLFSYSYFENRFGFHIEWRFDGHYSISSLSPTSACLPHSQWRTKIITIYLPAQ